MAKEFNNRSDETCKHDFGGGLCKKCLAPETPEDQQRAENAFYNADALEGKYSDRLGYTPTREQAIFEAWRSYRRA